MKEEIVNIIVPIVSIVPAFIALFISIYQITVSNKHALFDRRIKAYSIITRLSSLCNNNKYILNNIDENIEVEFPYIVMTNTTFLEDIQDVINHPLENDWQRKYIIKMEQLISLCDEVRLIFPNSIGYPLADFIYYYEEMIVSMYKFQCAIHSVSKQSFISSPRDVYDNKVVISRMKLMNQNIKNTFEISDRLFKEGILRKLANKIKV